MSDSNRHEASAGTLTDEPGESLSLAGNRNPWLVALVVSIATFMEVLDTSIANVSLRHIAGSLAASLDESTWVLTSYLVANAVVLPISGWLATVIGRKRFYMACVALFSVSSLLCGFAPSLNWLIVFRVLQGIGGGGLAPSEQSILADSFPPDKRGMAFALYGVAVVVAPAVGPTLGGWITDNYSWHWIFFINVPVGIISLGLSHWVLTEPPAETEHRHKLYREGFRVDYVGFGLVAVGLGCLQVVLDKGERDDWFGSHFIVTVSIISAVALVALVIWELSRDDPIVDLPLLADRGFLVSNLVMLAVGFILYSTTQLLPQLVQDVLGYTATYAGLVITPGGFAVMMLMPIIGLLLKKFQPRTLIAIGLLVEAYALFRMSGLNADVSFSDVMWCRVIQASGIAFLFVPVSTAAYIGLPPGKNNNASALVNLSRNLGGSVGISLVQTVLARRSQFHQTRMVEMLTPYDWQYQQALRDIQQVIGGSTSMSGGARAGLSMLYEMVAHQVTMLAYIDIFYLLACASLLMVPLTLLLRKAPPGMAPAH
ncbi:MAG TPA: DHA2 family efflux MFS transporter permease subunit [Pirellulales bacterium]|jgi:DHA2 family multidrug resistance protein|nr:DHA2 family efflux MFS transporter permease subunit [Pirellulales bacterium]